MLKLAGFALLIAVYIGLMVWSMSGHHKHTCISTTAVPCPASGGAAR